MKKRFLAASAILTLLLNLQVAPAQATSSHTQFGREIVLSAQQHIGLPYIWGGEDPNRGFDCSGLVKFTFEEFNINLPHRADLQYNYGQSVRKDQLEPGDIVFFATGGYPIGHVGIYIGNEQFIHAPRRGKPIQVDSITSGWFSNRFVGARRIVPDYF
ncbi:MAG: C40 family peptidase [Candidatus Sericytochromatia bacterium]|jgi:cell wall-associated NlpC family hydrolase|nr:C40 family peptidase [Candidatus Sericytochromatia bacterium]